MLTLFQRLFGRHSLSTLNFSQHVKNRVRPRSLEHSRSLGIERLEPRVLLAGFDFGDITDPASLRTVNDQEPTAIIFNPDNPQPDADIYRFSLPRPAVVIAALSDLRRTNLLDETGAGLSIFSIDELTGDLTGFASKDYPDGTTGDIRVSLPPGEYSIAVSFNIDGKFFTNTDPKSLLKSYDLSIHADTAPVDFTSGNPRATEGRNLGPLSTATGTDIQEYVGIGGPGSPAAVQDQVDMYLFDLVKQGTVEVKVTSGVLANGSMDFTLFRDANGNGVFDSGSSLEKLETKTEITSGETKIVSRILESGRYGIAVFVTPSTSNVGQADNYRLRTTYTVADGAGNTLAAARNAGTVGISNVAFSDYLSPNDPFDIYKFTTVAGGPFVFEGTLSGLATGSNFELDFIRDVDSDGVIDLSEVTSSDRNGNAPEVLSVPYTAPGTYFVRVRRTAGEGIYTLQFFNRNTDRGGNTLPTASVLFLFGFKEVDDHVSSTDTVDIYKFTLDLPSEFDAHLSAMPAATNANLSLIRDTDGDGVIDPGETLSSSSNTGNASEHIARTLAAGTYFVRVSRVSGAPSYNLRLVKDSVRNTLATALPLSPSGGEILDFLGPEDDSDVYRFTLGSTRLVRVSVGQNNEPLLVRLGQDTNGDGAIGFEGAELRINKTIDAGVIESINLSAGTYFLLVNAVIQDEGTTYGVILNNDRPDFAGNTLAAARPLGTLSTAQNFADFVGVGPIGLSFDDLDDFYTFTLGNDGPFLFQSVVNNLVVAGNRSAVIELIRDNNLNLQRDADEVVASTAARVISGTNVPGVINAFLDVPGNYYLRVKRESGQISYSLDLSANSLDIAGNSLDDALDLGPLASTINITNQFIGRIDRDDFFRFEVNNPGELVASLNGAADALYHVIRDIDNDGVVDPGETLAVAFGNRPLHGVVLPAAGDNYFVRVQAIGGDSLAGLSLTFSNQTPFQTVFLIDGVNPTEIKAVRFDKGGDGVSWHDTTPDNTGDQPGFRNAENIDVDVSNTVDLESIGRRVTNTAPGEFLEYTIHVAAGGFYDFDVRVSSPDPDASFHIEIDDVSLSNPVAVPDTNSADNMVTIVGASNVGLTAGPHILRLEIDTGTGVNNNFAGSFNFITVRPASTGTFRLTPSPATVAAWTSTNLSLSWTVPVGGWRVLKQVDLRLRDDCGRVIWIRFDEATNTMSMFNQATGKFGHARQVGSNGVLHNPLARVFMKTTTIAANGPDAPTVVITFDMMFNGRARGHWTIEAAASDDLGHRDPFKHAGELNVV